ncbi:dTDP-4-dehydrorhamnose 3,5-epimerase [Acididesulfobacillus acetoxydans]|uniref:dTDP-4-dehydrorhamnose 3,5-epimerase n=1 Tax=Acididesulfobacillus acetoxydans TaxID=1561005 RepID=A0A8S0WR77_9FIRM|nr:dTDP-4-dehydrorhamnose 3,5-epimerase [Acididesulfobacillus acetoxydans]CAA7603124.1 dTDP-4-dehydrorhamnose 3,5-epimerase [Acididesulfobacillus acetoxydans]CEJ05638.1 dTDP-4-dehydrorhamnose 3,5-epimerase [Acididesulfobacillus acetoxydans]
MNIVKTKLPGVVIIEPHVFGDARGFFMETWREDRYAEAGLPERFVQDNLSFSQKGVVRGLHFQNPNSQGKLVYVLQGEVFDVAVDIRIGSPSFSRWEGVRLSGENKRQFYIPAGFAHGFCVMSETALFAYKCTDGYNPQAEHGIIWNDPDVSIEWPVREPVLSEKDQRYGRLKDLAEGMLPRF